MSDTHRTPPDEWTDAERAAREAVRALPGVDADPVFRASLRDAFVSGTLDARATSRHGAQRRAPRRVFRVGVPVAMAAVLLLAFGLANRGPDWRVVKAAGVDTIWVDGEEVVCAVGPLETAFHPGSRVRVPDGGQVEVVTDALALQINGGTDMTLPAPPGRWFARSIESEVGGAGTLRIVTTEDFAGARYVIRAGATDLTVTGTAFSVMTDASVVCVCVLEGDVAATLPDGSMHVIPSGGRLTLARDGTAHDAGEMRPGEREALLEMQTELFGRDR